MVPVYCRWTPGRAFAFLDEPGLVADQYPGRIADRLHDLGTHVVADRVPVETRAAQQRLHRVRSTVAGLLGQGPAVTPLQRGHQPAQVLARLPAGLHPAEPVRELQEELLELLVPALNLLNRHHARQTIRNHSK